MRIERELTRDVDAPALVASGITVRIGRKTIVDGVSFDVGAGSWTCVIGPNGAGKTTLVHALAGLVGSSGEVALWGRPLDEYARRERAKAIALVPQLPTIPEGVTVAHYVLLGRTPHLGLLGGESAHDRDVADDAMGRLDIAWARDRRLETLSGGELRRAVLARALAQESPLVLLDEPTTGLDLGQQLRVLELVDELRREHGLTVVSTMHDLTLAGRFADRFVLMSGGRAVASGARDEVLTSHVIAEHSGAAVRIVDDGDLGWVVVPISERER
jgi:iron complex transport system ATP-binding protein